MPTRRSSPELKTRRNVPDEGDSRQDLVADQAGIGRSVEVKLRPLAQKDRRAFARRYGAVHLEATPPQPSAVVEFLLVL
jgi:hypothetical protein